MRDQVAHMSRLGREGSTKRDLQLDETLNADSKRFFVKRVLPAGAGAAINAPGVVMAVACAAVLGAAALFWPRR